MKPKIIINKRIIITQQVADVTFQHAFPGKYTLKQITTLIDSQASSKIKGRYTVEENTTITPPSDGKKIYDIKISLEPRTRLPQTIKAIKQLNKQLHKLNQPAKINPPWQGIHEILL